MANDYASAASDAQRSGIAAAYHLAFDLTNITSLIEFFMVGLGFFFIGYAMLKDNSLFGRPIAYVALLAGVLLVLALPIFAVPLAFGILAVVISLVLAAFDALVGMRLYRM